MKCTFPEAAGPPPDVVTVAVSVTGAPVAAGLWSLLRLVSVAYALKNCRMRLAAEAPINNR
jgi:hypothetical protein